MSTYLLESSTPTALKDAINKARPRFCEMVARLKGNCVLVHELGGNCIDELDSIMRDFPNSYYLE